MTAFGKSGSFSNPTRRAALQFGASAALAATSLPAWASLGEASHVSGQVFEDHTGAGNRRPGARGLSGVLVSNGVEVARTDAEGMYQLPLRPGQQVSVVTPASYQSPVASQTNLPQHFRDISARVDFPLTRKQVERQFNAILMADPQPENHRHLDFMRDGAIPALANMRASFGMTLGDIVGDDLSLMARYNAIMGQAGKPWWNVGGNHDLDFDAPDHASARTSFNRAYGPACYAFEQGDALFIVLDNVEYAGRTPDGGHGSYRGRIGAQQLAFLKNLLVYTPREKLLVLAMHIPLRTSWNPLSARDNTDDADALLALLAGRRAISFSGHMHATEHQYLQFEAEGRAWVHHHQVLAAMSGSWWSGPYDHRGRPLALGVDGCPPGFHVLHVDSVEYASTFVPLHAPQPRLRASLSRCTPCSPKGAFIIDGPMASADMPCELVVNVFDGGPRSQVRARLAGDEWRTLSRTRRADPFMIDHFAQPGAIRHDWVKPEPCEHLWTAPMPNLTAGLHRIEIEAQDEFGRILRDHVIAEVETTSPLIAAR